MCPHPLQVCNQSEDRIWTLGGTPASAAAPVGSLSAPLAPLLGPVPVVTQAEAVATVATAHHGAPAGDAALWGAAGEVGQQVAGGGGSSGSSAVYKHMLDTRKSPKTPKTLIHPFVRSQARPRCGPARLCWAWQPWLSPCASCLLPPAPCPQSRAWAARVQPPAAASWPRTLTQW